MKMKQLFSSKSDKDSGEENTWLPDEITIANLMNKPKFDCCWVENMST